MKQKNFLITSFSIHSFFSCSKDYTGLAESDNGSIHTAGIDPITGTLKHNGFCMILIHIGKGLS